MSSRELERVEVMGRVASGDLKLTSAAIMLELSYRQAKRLWRRYRQVGSQGLKHGNAGRPSNRSKPAKFRLEGRGPGGCLMDMVDDATSMTQARLGKEETIWAAVEVLRVWI